MTTKQPEALRLAEMLTADEWPGSVTLVSYARECVAELLRQHARITELESQLAQRFDAADMATAAAQGFRDGVASVSAGSEPVAWQYRSVRDKGLWFDCTEERAKQRAAHPDKWDVRYLYTNPYPKEGMAGWQPIETAPKDGSYLLLWEQYSDAPFVGYWSGGSWSVSHEHVDAEGGWDGANVVDALSMPITHWMPLPPAPGPADGESNELC